MIFIGFKTPESNIPILKRGGRERKREGRKKKKGGKRKGGGGKGEHGDACPPKPHFSSLERGRGGGEEE